MLNKLKGNHEHLTPSSRRFIGLTCRASATSAQKPAWTGDSIPSKVANWAINTPWIFGAMKVLAKDQMKSTAVKKGVDWDGHVAKLQAVVKELEMIKLELENTEIAYPEYYLKPFHAYDEGNLGWLAAFEVDMATMAVGLRCFGKMDPTISPTSAFERLAGGATNTLKAYYQQHNLQPPENIVDVGCSTGMSTRWLAGQFPEASITGVDLSPYFLAVAEWEQRQRRVPNIKYMHALAEQSGLPSASVDALLYQYIIHECPQKAIRDFVKESGRVLKPGGTLTFVDNNPRSKTIQSLPPAIAILMKSTEPWSDEYFSCDVEACMREGGFKEVVTVEIDHRHRAVMGIKA
ncbi:hypothetical protein CEUSTIGMA_g7342.t1 [Chlamydomonas eustigma]|uniref:Methyltransferase type 11 domain-containing protein n=1 Tax=Chlamydomonas eustigma TaxID=1157962 RepID=A0A250XAL7_9CHLO|nr:hypothetical protein CEUSTIGMA_g7342.t1 [Chlamydomonas eustigma]|eukprot:GAX79902.1 hypothetical protein CEUSTIGMA_g7342.t1 [Chlamydomonas eustigma]